MERRFIKALGEFFPDRAFRLYMDSGALCLALNKAGFPSPDNAALEDPAFTSNGKANISLWRPFLEPSDKASILIPILPWPMAPEVLVLEKNLEASFPAGDLIPPVLLAPAARALYNLAAAMKAKAPNRASPRYPKIEKVLKSSPQVLWRRRGIYLTVEPDIERGKYTALFRHFLEGGFLIPPSPAEPLILPMSMSPGEESKLAGLLGGIYESGAISP